ncbi:MAG: acyl-CoA dehydrogenase family protein [Acidimicrobiales bacterium]
MHFAFTDQQLEFRDAVRQVLAKECTTADLRAAYDAPSARTPRWATLAGLGVTGITVPEVRGGLDLGLVDLVPLLEEAGAVALPEPLAETTGVAAPLLADLESAGAGGGRIGPWLEGIASGSLTVAVADPRRPGIPVAGADGADLLLVTSVGADGPEIHGIDATAVAVTPVPSLDPTRRLGTPEWEPSAGTLLASGPIAATSIARTGDRAAVVVGAELLGLAGAMIGLAADYARDRHQFGRPIGSFQAVKHLLAGAQVLLEFARPVVYGAAWALDDGATDGSRAASVAKAYASDAAVEAARVSLQVHGAIGYTWECDLHLLLKRTWALAEAWGSAGDHRGRLLDSLLAGH